MLYTTKERRLWSHRRVGWSKRELLIMLARAESRAGLVIGDRRQVFICLYEKTVRLMFETDRGIFKLELARRELEKILTNTSTFGVWSIIKKHCLANETPLPWPERYKTLDWVGFTNNSK